MPKGFRSRLTFANVASALALFMAVGGGGAVAVGAIGGSNGTIKACYVKKGNADRGTSTGEIRLLLKGKCHRGEKAFSFNAKGSPGVAGAPGAPGSPGANGSARAYGQISGQGVVNTALSTPGVTAVRQSEGIYCVTVPGLTPSNAVMLTSVNYRDVDSHGADTAAPNAECGPAFPGGFQVTTWDPRSAIDTAEDDAGFNFMIP
jgi:hypothetical protein